MTTPCPTLVRDGAAILILDQTALPHRREVHRLATLAGVAHAIRAMQVRGAPLIGATAACGMALAMQEDATDAGFAAALAELAATRPTAVNLHWALARIKARLENVTPADRPAAAWAEAEAVIAEDVAQNAAIGRRGLPLIEAIAARRPGPVRVMTHCNAGWLATCGHGTALAPVYAAHAAGIPVTVWVSETRPRNQGLLTSWELAESGVPHRLIADDTASKVGTYLKALAARDNDVPFYIAAPGSTLDFACPDGSAIPIEDRGTEEVLTIAGLDAEGRPATLRLAPAGTAAANPAFDVTPARLITAILTERGLAAPDRLGELYPERPPAGGLKERRPGT